jgi:hypothetical protein
MKNARMTICLVVAVLVLASSQGVCVVEYKDGGTHDISSTIYDDLRVDYMTPLMYTTVNLLDGAYTDHEIGTFGNSHLTVSGGSVHLLAAFNDSTLTMTSGIVHDNILAFGRSHLVISGGFLGRYNLFVSDDSHVEWSGGTLGGPIRLPNCNSRLTIYGSNFVIDGVSIDGSVLELRDYISSHPMHEHAHIITGILANGDIINNIIIPEPCTLVLLGVGGMLIRKR